MSFSTFLREKKLFFLGISVALVAAILDLLSKGIIFRILENIAVAQSTPNPEIQITGFFNLVYVWNRGVSFGMFHSLENSQIIFCVIQALILLVLLFWLYRNQKIHLVYAIALIIGGALGNLFDRIKHGAVADFLDFYVASYHWPAFNLADSFVFIGVAILVFEDFIFKKR